MRFSDVRRVAARPADVWDALHDPAVLGTFPGCDRLIPLGDGEYAAIVSAQGDQVTDTYRGLLTLIDGRPGSEVQVVLTGRGRGGTLETDVRIQLERGGTRDSTTVRFDARAWVAGLTPPQRCEARKAVARVAECIVGELERAVRANATVAV